MEGSVQRDAPLARRFVYAGAALAAGLFVLDLWTPVGVATGVAYVTVVAMAGGGRQPIWVLFAATLATALTAIGFVLSPGDHSNPYALANRALAVLLIWLVAIVTKRRLRAERRFAIAVEASPSGMLLCTSSGRILFANGEAHRMFGYGLGELAGLDVERLTPDTVRPRHANLRASYMANPEVRQLGVGRELHGRRKDGGEFPVEVGLTPVATERGRFVLVAVVDVSSRFEAQMQNERLAAIVRSSHDAITAVDLEGRITAWNEGAERTHGWSAAEMIGQPFRRLLPEGPAREFETVLDRVRAGGAVESLITEQQTKERGTITVSASIAPIRGPTGRVVGASAIARDITAQKRAENMLLETTMALTNAMPGISRVGADGRIEYGNPDFADLFGKQPEQLRGMHWRELLAESEQPAAEAAFEEMLRQGKAEFQVGHTLGDTTGFLAFLLVRRLDEKGRFLGHHCFARDDTDRRRSEVQLQALADRLAQANDRLQMLAEIDPLTSLSNRRGLQRALAVELERALRQGSPTVAILIDLDDFKAINERYGHATGDSVLIESARRIHAAARTYDHVARIGGDEFLLLLPDTRTAEGLLVGERVRQAVACEPVIQGTTSVRISASCGVEEIPPGCASIAAILALCRASLERAKHTGKDRVASGNGGGAPATPVTTLLRGRQLRAVQQPIYDLKDRVVIGHELLSRGPRGPFENPADFLQAGRLQGVLADLDLACLRNCLQAASLLPNGHRIHVNLLPTTLEQTPIEQLLELIDKAPDGIRLCIELHEHDLVDHTRRLRQQLDALRARDIQLAIEGVGFGRSSLESLLVLEPDLVKISPRYVHGLAREPGRRRAFDRLMNVLGALRTQAIGGGIEHAEDLEVLLMLGLRYGQGFLLGVPAEVVGRSGDISPN